MSDTPMYKKLSRVINGALVGALTAVVLLMAVVILPGLIGFKPVVVLSGSMEPALHVGDVAVLRPVDSDRLKVGDVITYRSAGHLTTHRIIRIEEGQSGLAFYTKGDANETADGAPVHGDSIVAMVFYSVPRLGFLVTFANSTAGMLALIVGPAGILALMWIRDRMRKGLRGRTMATATPAEQAVSS